jgi:hypothetical protein
MGSFSSQERYSVRILAKRRTLFTTTNFSPFNIRVCKFAKNQYQKRKNNIVIIFRKNQKIQTLEGEGSALCLFNSLLLVIELFFSFFDDELVN